MADPGPPELMGWRSAYVFETRPRSNGAIWWAHTGTAGDGDDVQLLNGPDAPLLQLLSGNPPRSKHDIVAERPMHVAGSLYLDRRILAVQAPPPAGQVAARATPVREPTDDWTILGPDYRQTFGLSSADYRDETAEAIAKELSHHLAGRQRPDYVILAAGGQTGIALATDDLAPLSPDALALVAETAWAGPRLLGLDNRPSQQRWPRGRGARCRRSALVRNRI